MLLKAPSPDCLAVAEAIKLFIKPMAQLKLSFKALLAWHRARLSIATYPVGLLYISPASQEDFQ